MDKNEFKERIKKIEQDKKGIVNIIENQGRFAYVTPISSMYGEETLYISDEYMNIKSCILIGQAAKKKGITEGYLLNAIKEKYGKDYKEAIRTLGFICIPESEKDLDSMLNANINLNNEDEYGLYTSLGYDKNLYSYTFIDVQTIMINEPLYRYLPDEEYKQKILDSLFHEIEFLLTTTNFIMTESLFNKTVPNLKDPQVYRTSLEEYNEEEHEL